MKTYVKATQLSVTPSLSAYIDRKFATIAKLVKKFDKEDAVEIRLEVGRTTKHHHKGPVFRAEANLLLPGKILRAVEENIDIRTALDIVKDKLHLEIEKYKTKGNRGLRERRNKS